MSAPVLLGGVEDPAHRPMRCLHVLGWHNERKFSHHDDRRRFASQSLQHQFGRGGSGFIHVGVRILLVADHRVGVPGDFHRHVGVQIEGNDDGNSLADNRPNRLQNLSLAIVGPLGAHRAMQGEQQSVEGTLFADLLGDGVSDLLEGRRRHRPGRHRPPGEQRYCLVLGGSQYIEKRSDLGPRSPPSVENRRAQQEAEIVETSFDRRKRIGFLQQVSDADSHLFSRARGRGSPRVPRSARGG